MTNKSLLSQKKLPKEERLMFALDVPSHDEARKLVENFGDIIRFYKIGLELFMAGDYFSLLDWLVNKKQKQVLVDLKFFDVPETVKSAVRQLKDRHATFATVHGNDTILKAAVEGKSDLKILAVTALTSLDRGDLEELGFQCDVEELVFSRAKRALNLGCDGVISSGLEAKRLRSTLGENFLIVTPGIRPVDNIEDDDQKRTVNVEQAFLNGADYIVIGRPIRNAPNPVREAEKIQEKIASLFE